MNTGHFLPLKVEDILVAPNVPNVPNDNLNGQKCRIVGYMQLRDGEYYLENVNTPGSPKVRIMINTDKLKDPIPPHLSPSGVQVFGTIVHRDMEESVEKNDHVYIEAAIVQHLPPSLVLNMYQAIHQAKRRPHMNT